MKSRLNTRHLPQCYPLNVHRSESFCFNRYHHKLALFLNLGYLANFFDNACEHLNFSPIYFQFSLRTAYLTIPLSRLREREEKSVGFSEGEGRLHSFPLSLHKISERNFMLSLSRKRARVRKFQFNYEASPLHNPTKYLLRAIRWILDVI